ncbi:MAG: tRNA (N(6)-L-threonylcarbamoyladenosine(37)-C(2))-methylthiotransferase MtaB [Clostridia bacterium]|nr:tRNA (N(6)-L-threonylcarbamoyladenosine(37)-C(2))-methylthiotransferase MtaB [Clostridia bacterium]
MNTSQKKKVAFVTLGCKVNTYEAEAIAANLEQANFECISGLQKADIYVLSTCAVTNEGERKSRGQIAKILKLNPNAEIYVCGCASEHNAQQFLKFPNVKYVVGTNNKLKIADIITGKIKPDDRSSKEEEAAYNDSYKSKHTRARAVIKIQDGCNNFCTYCLIPYLRGRERSRSLSSILFEIENLEKTTKEIVITGINVSAYGKDFKNQNTSLVDVVKLFSGRSVKFRFSSLEVRVITNELLLELAKLPNFQPHFHLSMQSACNETLSKMNRKYTIEEYTNKVNLIRSYFPDAGITTDVIVGFPTETAEHFETTLENCKKIGFCWMHVFPYSKRDGTVAAGMNPVASGEEVRERAKRLGCLAEEMRDDFTRKMIGSVQDVIVEQEKDGFFVGHSGNFVKCYIKSKTKLEPNEVVKVEIKDVHKDGAIAVLWTPPK